MAIKVNGTTVIDDSRNLVNIVSGAGSSTTFGDVGTYAFGTTKNVGNTSFGATSSSFWAVNSSDTSINSYWNGESNSWEQSSQQALQSGTWRHMGGSGGQNNNYGLRAFLGLWVRIS